ncbi:cytochrome c biogenesis protein ResB [Marisediminicola senii]|uniref:cytochrome c biogenesis protein ResB n=1 Tax=Marisediminicola senii TaxID=2711233 RepID=UPI001F1DFE8C|nr:cytochrome c biogenesis protein ResB [Marisediminicola senii]
MTQPSLGFVGYLRFFWRQLTSMRTALFLLLLLAIAAIPGSLVPQRSSNPNGVTQYFTDNPDLAPVLDRFQAFDVYSSAWFSAIYLLLFVSLIGCVIPRTVHHWKALRSQPPRTPARLSRLEGFREVEVTGNEASAAGVTPATAVEAARGMLRGSGYRARIIEGPGAAMSVSAERGYMRETGNLVFHTALIGVLVSVGIGGGYGYSGQKVIVEGDSFSNVLLSYESFLPGRFFDEGGLEPFRVRLDDFEAVYEQQNPDAYGQPIDFSASVTTFEGDDSQGDTGDGVTDVIKVNDPLRIGGSDLYLLGNGYAPLITVRDAEGNVAFSGAVPFLPQDGNLTSLGVIKVPDAEPEQIGMIGFLYPTQTTLETGALASNFPDLLNPVLSLQVFTGDLGLDGGVPRSVYTLETDNLTEIAGRTADTESLRLTPGETVDLPGGRGSVTFENATPDAPATDLSGAVPRFVSLDIHRDPSQGWVLVFALLVVAGLLTSLFIPRRRVWVRATETTDGGFRLEYAGLARGDDPGLERAVGDIAQRHSQRTGLG